MIAASYARLLLAGLCQLTLATSDSAEGAWVAWVHSVFQSKGSTGGRRQAPPIP